jgi:hypothetical protein
MRTIYILVIFVLLALAVPAAPAHADCNTKSHCFQHANGDTGRAAPLTTAHPAAVTL